MSVEYPASRVLLHEGPCEEALKRYQAVARDACRNGRRPESAFASRLMTYVSDERLLYSAFQHVRQHGGAAPGRDGLRASDLGQSDQWKLARTLRDELREGTYQPDEPLRREVPKRPGSEERRTIWISSLPDRVVARAAALILRPMLAPLAEPLSFGCFVRGPAKAVVVARLLVERYGRRLLIKQDLCDAFDHVPRARLFQLLRSRIRNREFCELVSRLTATPAVRGVRQGSALSAQLLNLYLDHAVDRRWSQLHPDVPCLRYIDDYLLFCRPGDDATALHNEFAALVTSAGFRLKYAPDQAISRIDRTSVDWLGYRLSSPDARLIVKPLRLAADDPQHAERLRQEVAERFARLHDKPHGWIDAPSVARSLLVHAAPTFPFVEPRAICRLIVAAAAEGGCDLAEDELCTFWREAFWNLQKLRPPRECLAAIEPQTLVHTTSPATWVAGEPPF